MTPVIGIDFGTTNTVVSYFKKNGKLRPMRYNGEDSIPSVICFRSKSEWIIGEDAKKLKGMYPEACVESFKSNFRDKDYLYEIKAINGDTFRYKPKFIAQCFLESLMEYVSDKLMKEFGEPEARVVITVPAKFNSTEKEITRAAAMGTNMAELKLAAEPTAAAIACQYNREEDHIPFDSVMVYDFGGGTFDVSVVKKEKGVFQQIAIDGDKYLGGNNLTDKLAHHIMEAISEEYDIDFPWDADELDEDVMSFDEYMSNRSQVWDAANQLKEDLSTEEERDIQVSLKFNGISEMFEALYTRRQFERLIEKDIRHSIELVKKVQQEAVQKGVDNIDCLVLAGGSSYIPMVSELLAEALPDMEIDSSEDCGYMISQGAAILANSIEDIDNMTQQITNVQMGIKITDGVTYNKFKMLIPENVALPYVGEDDFSLSRDNQQKLEIAYYEYDVKNYPGVIRVDENGVEEVDVLILDLPAGLKKDEVKVHVRFMAQTDGSLDISADIRDASGKSLVNGVATVTKRSELE